MRRPIKIGLYSVAGLAGGALLCVLTALLVGRSLPVPIWMICRASYTQVLFVHMLACA